MLFRSNREGIAQTVEDAPAPAPRAVAEPVMAAQSAPIEDDDSMSFFEQLAND